MSGHRVDEESSRCILDSLGAGTWFSFGDSVGTTNQELSLLRPGSDLASAAESAKTYPGRTWLIGNEPNLPGQDDLSPGAFADFAWRAATALLVADSTAILVGPNVLNWDTPCPPGGCQGFQSGHGWADEFVADYRDRYGPLPFLVWGMHTYTIDWAHLPMVDPMDNLEQLTAARAWLDQQGIDVPIWLTEFGVLWGYEGVDLSTGRARGVGDFREDALTSYMDQMFIWLLQSGPSYRVERWYLYATAPPPEPYADEVGGISLLHPGTLELTVFGERYRSWALDWSRQISYREGESIESP